MNEPTRETRLNPRLVLVILFAVFLAPVIVAVILNSRWVDWQPEPTRNHGQLIAPVVAAPAALREALPAGDRWILLTTLTECTAECTRMIDEFDRIDRALGHRGEELVPVIALDAGSPANVPNRVAVIADEGRWRRFLEGLDRSPGTIFVMDPLGNLMLSFPPDHDPSEIKDDLERLIKYSRFEAP